MFGILKKWRQEREIEDAEHQKAVQVIQNEHQAVLSEQMLKLKSTELTIADQYTDLQHKKETNRLDIEQRTFNLYKERDALEQNKAQFHIHLDTQRQELDLQRERFYKEQERLDKETDYSFQAKIYELDLRKQELTQNHVQAMGNLELQAELSRLQRLDKQEQQAEKTLNDMRMFREQERTYAHTENMRKIDLEIKKFEAELAFIKTLDADKQETAYNKLRSEHLKRMQDLNATMGDYTSDTF